MPRVGLCPGFYGRGCIDKKIKKIKCPKLKFEVGNL
jgi:hypothetical protein